MNTINVMAAKTHTPEYLLHKYWARKPHNIISWFIGELVPEGGVVVDPFCGSGVVLHEAQKRSCQAYGFDVNPTAVLISSVLLQPPATAAFEEAMEGIFRAVERDIAESFQADGRLIKYCVHEVVTLCPSCGKEVTPGNALQKKRSRFCGQCGAAVRFNLENLKETRIVGVALEGEKNLLKEPSVLARQELEKNRNLFDGDYDGYSRPFCENRRILAFQGMETRNLFTPRNFSILCRIEEEIDRIQDQRVRDAARLLLSASIAQCSRLIAMRNNLSTGGPAWSVPGFWVPAEHLETNPLIHLKARYQKFIKGLNLLNSQKRPAACAVKKLGFSQGIDSLLAQDIKADMVFFDPPYGDSVPYLEFSAMWNSFLKDFPDVNEDISVSDRRSRNEAWQGYREDLNAALEKIGSVLKPSGRLLITFNNNDLRAWEALLSGLQQNHFVCECVTYQIPAVISSKAQMAVEGSYISDIYSVYERRPDSVTTRSLTPVSNRLVTCASFRGGIITKGLAGRVIMMAWLQENVDVSLLPERDRLLTALFDEKDGRFVLKANTQEDSEFDRVSLELAGRLLEKGPCEWQALYEYISKEVAEYGIPDPYEVKEALAGHVVFDGKRCLSCVSTETAADEGYRQLTLPGIP